jgi:putative hydrolase of the HAD superfamily
MTKAVIFDLGGVIVGFDFGRAYGRLKEMCGLEPEAIRARIGAAEIVPAFESGRMESREFVERLRQALGLKISDAEFRELWFSIFEPETLIPEALLERLKQDYRLVLLSNTNELHFEMLAERYGLLRHFDEWVLSYRVGVMKPAPEIYAEAVKRAGCAAGECFYTDDVAAFVEGARAAGIDAEQFHGYEKLLGDLRARGIAV